MSATIGLPDILGVADVATLDPKRTWQPRPLRERLRVPIGIGANGHAVMLDLKESAHGGMGPHGLVVGATGSGKSEMLRTLLTSLVISHPPELLALMLVDFKGGATFAPMAGLPHVAGIVTNIEDDITLVDRMHDALFGEMRRRQEVLKEAGNLPNVSAYHALREAGEPLEPLPHLLVVIDEFSELLSAKPDFAELFVAIGRIGRSIGVHQLLATQRLDMGKIRGLESHLSYRISLRTFSETESREAIGVPDAYHLPPEPGSGYLKVDTTVFSGSRPRWSPPVHRRRPRPRRWCRWCRTSPPTVWVGGWPARPKRRASKRTSLSSRTRRGRGSGRSWMWRWSDWPPPVRPGPSGVAGPTTGDPSAGHGAGSAGPRRRDLVARSAWSTTRAGSGSSRSSGTSAAPAACSSWARRNPARAPCSAPICSMALRYARVRWRST